MATATIVLRDDGKEVQVTVEFGEEGAQDDSPSHHMAVAMVRSQLGGVDDEEDD